ncbi:MAG: 3-deoxy-manno-octulosonate cytidylyltransferase [Planctomycetota bacterium]
MSSDAIAIIPARLESGRLPRKVLLRETGKPLIQHVHESASRSARVSRVVVATDSEEVASAVRAFGGESVMTSRAHENGSSRIAEACEVLALSDDTVVVNVQGDEPELDAAWIDRAADAMRIDGCAVGTVASTAMGRHEGGDPNVVKVVTDRSGRAMYFSRAPIPWDREAIAPGPSARHIGLYAYRVRTLRDYVAWEPTALERIEKLEQLRFLEHDVRIGVALVDDPAHAGIDTPEQYKAFVERWRETNS